MSRGKRAFVGILCSITASASILWFVGTCRNFIKWGKTYTFVPPTAVQVNDYSRVMSLRLPAACEPLALEHVGGLDDIIFLKLRMTHEEAKELVANYPFKDLQLSQSEKHVTPEKWANFEPWKVDAVKQYRSGVAQLPDAKTLHILIDLDQPQFAIVYLEYREY